MTTSRLRLKRSILTLTFAVTSVCLYSCSRPEPSVTGLPANATPAPPSPMPTIALDSKQLVASDPKGQYLLIKQTLAKVAPAPDPEQDLGILWSCTAGRDFLGASGDELIPPLADLAYDIIYVRKSLENIQYPEARWKNQLVQFEKEQLELLVNEIGQKSSDDSPSFKHDAAFKEQLVREVNNYRRRTSPDLPEVLDYEGCGAGEVKINLKTNPDDGRAVMIPVFFFELCKAQQLNPDDAAQCKWWIEPAEGLMLEVSGDYFFRATWPDGIEKRGRMSFDPSHDGETITITKP